MSTGSIPLFSLLTGRMTWLSARQSLLSENVANADTPKFVARDLKEMDFPSLLAGQNGSHLMTTQARHIAMPHRNGGIAIVPEKAAAEGGTPNGSQVSLEEEMIKLSDTQLQYQTATNLYQKTVAMFRTALGTR
jgi:flagellar basal-body rod protein FlgB